MTDINDMLYEDMIINLLFDKPTWFSKVRFCKYNPNYKIKENVLYRYRGDVWIEISWLEFCEYIKNIYNEKIEEEKYKNNNRPLYCDWSFLGVKK